MAQAKQFSGKTVLLSGASSGIGACFAEQLAEQGADLILTARSAETLNQLAGRLRQQYAVKVSVFPADLAQTGAAQALYERILQAQLVVDILINNAGFGKWTEFLQQDLRTYQQMLQLNIQSLTELSYLCLPAMLARRSGGIINVASTGAFQPLPYIAVYGASKAYVLSLTEAMATEYKNTGLQFQVLCPGNTHTNFARVANANTSGMTGASPEDVVRSSLRAWHKGEVCHIHGTGNFLTALLPRILPRKMVTAIVAAMFKDKLQPAAPRVLN